MKIGAPAVYLEPGGTNVHLAIQWQGAPKQWQNDLAVQVRPHGGKHSTAESALTPGRALLAGLLSALRTRLDTATNYRFRRN